MTQSLSGCLRLTTHEVRVSEDEVFASCMIETVHPLDLPWLFPLALKNSLNLKRLVHYELKLYQKIGWMKDSALMVASDPQFTEANAAATVSAIS